MGIQGLVVCLVLCLALGRISGKLNVLETLEDIKEQTNFGKHNPRQGLALLCWLLNQAKIDQNGNLRLNFNPPEEHYGFHQYKNYDLDFPDLSNTNFLYFTFGSLCYKKAQIELPGYFIQIQKKSQNHPQRNIDRIVIRVRKDNPKLVDEVFITQHFEDRSRGSSYDQDLTFKISKQLLKKIAELCQSDEDSDQNTDQNPDQNDPDYNRFRKIQRMFPNAPYLHLFLYLVNYNPDKNVKEDETSKSSGKSDDLVLKLRPSPNGRARIVWDWIPNKMMEREMKICVYQNKDAVKPLFECPLDGMLCGEGDTDLSFNDDLDVRLEPITTLETSENRDKDQTAPKFFMSSYLLSLVLYPFSSLISLVLHIFSSLFSLVLHIFSSLFSLVLYIFSSLFSLVLYIFSSLFSLVLYIFSSLFSLVLYIFSSLFSLVLYIFSCVFNLVFYIFSSLYSLVLYLFSSLFSLLISILVIGVVAVILCALTESRAEPDFVRVSHGRPGY